MRWWRWTTVLAQVDLELTGGPAGAIGSVFLSSTTLRKRSGRWHHALASGSYALSGISASREGCTGPLSPKNFRKFMINGDHLSGSIRLA
jgi:hypothetical protein